MLKKITPLHLYLLFVALILVACFFEGKVDTAYYLFVALGWICFVLAVKKYASDRKSKPKGRRK
jgi:L-asparagine transporter-like permease